MAKIGIVEYCNERGLNLNEYVDDLKNKIHNKDHALNRLIVTINELRDKVQHRNIQIKKLKGTLGEVRLEFTRDDEAIYDYEHLDNIRSIVNA